TASKWQFTVYDALDRPFITGLYYSPQTKEGLSNTLTSATTYDNPSVFHYLKDYTVMPAYPSTFTNAEILSYTYYDNYANVSAGFTFDNSLFPNITQNYLVQPVKSAGTRGLVTGSKTRLLGVSTESWITTV